MHELRADERFPRSASLAVDPRQLGDGRLGRSCSAFLHFLAHAGVSAWHALSIFPADEDGAPLSYCALAPELIDTEMLVRAGLISAESDGAQAAAKKLVENPEIPMHAAFLTFAKEHAWLEDWALFAALRETYGTPQDFPRVDEKVRQDEDVRCRMHAALQFFVHTQWQTQRVQGFDMGIRFSIDVDADESKEGVSAWLGDSKELWERRKKTLVSLGENFRIYSRGEISATRRHSFEALGVAHFFDDMTARSPAAEAPVYSLDGAFGGDAQNHCLPHHHSKEGFVCSGISEAPRRDGWEGHILAYVPSSDAHSSWLRAVLMSPAHTALISAADIFPNAGPFDRADYDAVVESFGETLRCYDRDELKRYRDTSRAAPRRDTANL